jgi:uncharacterized protein YwbE
MRKKKHSYQKKRSVKVEIDRGLLIDMVDKGDTTLAGMIDRKEVKYCFIGKQFVLIWGEREIFFEFQYGELKKLKKLLTKSKVFPEKVNTT